MFRVAVIGAGRMGALHALNAAAHPELELAWICDASSDAAARLAVETGATAASIETILGDREVRGVIVASATASHLENCLACLRAGKAVFCEKPLSLSSEALASALPQLCAPESPAVFVAFNRRFDRHFRTLKARLNSGELGRIETLHIISHDPALPSVRFVPASGGLFRDFTIHDFDLVSWLIGEPVVELFAFGGNLIDPVLGSLGDVDTAKIILRTSLGTLCMISNSRRSGYGYDQRIEVYCSRGALRVDNCTTSSLQLWGEAGARGAPILPDFVHRYADAYRAELDHFVDVIERGVSPEAHPGDSLRALQMAEAALLSHNSGGPVSLMLEQD